MPAGIEQPIREVGWQLSHGERSRVYIARALLTGASVMVLDEAFATLDPEALRRTLTCVLARAPALIAIAHQSSKRSTLHPSGSRPSGISTAV